MIALGTNHLDEVKYHVPGAFSKHKLPEFTILAR